VKNAGADQRSTATNDLVRAYFIALEEKDLEGLVAILTEDAVLEMPFDVAGTNNPRDLWRGTDGAAAHYSQAFTDVASISFTDVAISPTIDPDVVFAEALGEMAMVNGRPYNNRYVFRFDLRDGKIQRIREYGNPVTSAISFGLPLPAP
jgi:ketosteroid isomerase-like protein